MSLFSWLFTYILGGITFIPVVAIAFVAYTFYTSEKAPHAATVLTRFDEDEKGPLLKEKDGKERDTEEKLKIHATVRRTFEPQPLDNSGSYVSSLRSLLATSQAKGARKETAWLALKGHVLYLYEDEACTDVLDVISLPQWEVSIFPSEGLLEGELFSKRNSIMLSPKAKSTTTDSPSESESLEMPYFLFIPSLTTMETTYHTLLHVSDPSLLASIPSIFRSDDIDNFISVLHSTSDPLPTRWFNTLIARMFFSYYRTDSLEAAICARLNKKLGKIKRPGWLTALSVPRVDVGTSPPMISKPMLKNLTTEGEASVEMAVSYKGKFKITLSATATFSLPSTTLSRARTYTVHLLLSVTLTALSGNLLVLIRPPPSNRIWYAFTSPPQLELSVDPVVSDRQIKWGLVLSTIESRLREVILESVVLPNMDDIPFFNSDSKELKFKRRGGMWGDAERKMEKVTTSAMPTDTDGEAQEVTLPTTPINATSDTEGGREATGVASPTTLTQPSSATASGSTTPRKRTWFGAISSSTALPDSGDKTNLTPTATPTADTHFKAALIPESPKMMHTRSLSAGSKSISNANEFESEISDAARHAEVEKSSAANGDSQRPTQAPVDTESKAEVPEAILSPKAASIVITDTSEAEHEANSSIEIPRSSSSPADLHGESTSSHGGDEGSVAGSSTGAGRNRASSVSSMSSAGSSLRPSSPYFSDVGASTDGDNEGKSNDEGDDPELSKKTLLNTKQNSSTAGSFLQSLRGKNLKELRDTNWKEGKEILSAQALGVVRKWGWKGKGNIPGGNGAATASGTSDGDASQVASSSSARPRPASIGSIPWVRDRRASTTSAGVTSGEEVDGEDKGARQLRAGKGTSEERQDYGSLRDRARDRNQTHSNTDSEDHGGYLTLPTIGGIGTERGRTSSLPPNSSSISTRSVSPSSSSTLAPGYTAKSSTSLPKSSLLSSIPPQSFSEDDQTPTQISHTPSSPKQPMTKIPIHRSQPSAAQIPRMAIPGIPSSRKGEVMSISSSSVAAPVSSDASGSGAGSVASKEGGIAAASTTPSAGDSPSKKESPSPLPIRVGILNAPKEANTNAQGERERDRSASPSGSKASDALMEVVARDSEERARRASIERNEETEKEGESTSSID